MFSFLQVTGVLLCGAFLWSGYSKPPLKGKARIASRRKMARNAMSRTLTDQPGQQAWVSISQTPESPLVAGWFPQAH
jgi:hypothetical protein